MAKEQHKYVTISPVTPKGKWLVAMQRIGGKDRMAILAEVRTEGAADAIVAALDAMEGRYAKLEKASSGPMEDLKRAVAEHKGVAGKLRSDLLGEQQKRREVERSLENMRAERDGAKAECARVRIEFAQYRDANPQKATA